MSTKFLPQITVPFPKMTLFGNIFWDNFQPSLDQEFSPHHAVCLWLRDCANKLLRIHLCGRPWRKDCFHMKKQKMLGTTFKHMGLSNSKALVVFHLLKKLVRSWMYAILQYLCTSGVLLFRTRLPFTQLERVAHSRQAWKDVETSWSCKIAATATKPKAKFATTISSWPSVPQSNRFIWR